MQPQTTMSGDRGNIGVLLPVWKPGADFVYLIDQLQTNGFAAIIVVDDGSGREFASRFEAVAAKPNLHVLQHAVNLGKGRALKTGFSYVLTCLPDLLGVVTADSDGQHVVTDISAVADSLCAAPKKTVLGVRSFSESVPFRSRVGNLTTRCVFRFVTGADLNDTQTGLRGIPTGRLSELLALDGERYEYETAMLAHLCRDGERPSQVPIATVYIEGNRSSHFDPIRDSMRIYFVLLRFCASSLIAAGIDFAAFSVAFAMSHDLLISVAIGRVSSLVNFGLNRHFVFNSHSSIANTLARYYLLAIAVVGLSYVSIHFETVTLGWNVFAAKAITGVLLSSISFSAQRTFVFRRSRDL